jgi:hypothetical protein
MKSLVFRFILKRRFSAVAKDEAKTLGGRA